MILMSSTLADSSNSASPVNWAGGFKVSTRKNPSTFASCIRSLVILKVAFIAVLSTFAVNDSVRGVEVKSLPKKKIIIIKKIYI